MKYNIGDKVRVRSDLRVGRAYGSMHFVEDMRDLCGTVVTINQNTGISYGVKEYRSAYWTDEMFEGLAEETPREFKVGDRVKVNEIGLEAWGALKRHNVDFGTVIVYENKDEIGIEFDKDFGGHDCWNKGKNGHCWWLTEREIELIKEEPKKEPTPTPVVNVNVTVNLYENACWYCRKGGLVDLYLAGAMGICPSCGRVCNNTVPTKPKKESIVIEFKTPEKPKENKPLTTEELRALPNGTKVFTLWIHGEEELWTDPRSCWREKRYDHLKRVDGSCGFGTNGMYYRAYLEEPKRPS